MQAHKLARRPTRILNNEVQLQRRAAAPPRPSIWDFTVAGYAPAVQLRAFDRAIGGLHSAIQLANSEIFGGHEAANDEDEEVVEGELGGDDREALALDEYQDLDDDADAEVADISATEDEDAAPELGDANAAPSAPVQRRGGTELDPVQVRAAATHGLGGAGGTTPHLAHVQRAFGRHDVRGVRSVVGGRASEACAAMGAEAYASGEAVAFRGAPSLHTVAHELTHVVQQRRGVALSGGVGAVGDRYEKEADEVADRVVRGESVEGLLDGIAGAGRNAPEGPVQRRASEKSKTAEKSRPKTEAKGKGQATGGKGKGKATGGKGKGKATGGKGKGRPTGGKGGGTAKRQRSGTPKKLASNAGGKESKAEKTKEFSLKVGFVSVSGKTKNVGGKKSIEYELKASRAANIINVPTALPGVSLRCEVELAVSVKVEIQEGKSADVTVPLAVKVTPHIHGGVDGVAGLIVGGELVFEGVYRFRKGGGWMPTLASASIKGRPIVKAYFDSAGGTKAWQHRDKSLGKEAKGWLNDQTNPVTGGAVWEWSPTGDIDIAQFDGQAWSYPLQAAMAQFESRLRSRQRSRQQQFTSEQDRRDAFVEKWLKKYPNSASRTFNALNARDPKFRAAWRRYNADS